MKNLSIIFILLLSIILTPCLFAESVGKIVSTQGRVDIFKDGCESAVPAIGDDAVSVGDSIRTKSGSKAQVVFSDRSVLKLAQNSKITVKDYQVDEKAIRKSASIELSRGKARAIIAKMRNPADFVIITPNAEGTVKGSDVTAFYQAGNSGMFVSEGKLSVINIAHPKERITVPKGNACVVPMGELPKGPRPYLDVEKKLNDEDTYISVSISKTGKVSVIKGAVAKVSGTVNIIPKGAAEAHKASINDILGEGDKVDTGENGHIEIRLDNNNAINLKPGTKLTIIRLVINPETGEFENIFEVTMGKIKARIENLKGNSKFEVKTPQAVCGARGTIMYLDVSQSSTTSFFEGGNGYMTNTLTGNARDIPPGTSSSTDYSGNVSNPVQVSDSDRQSYGEGWDPGNGTEGYSSPEGNAGAGLALGSSDIGTRIAGALGRADTLDSIGGIDAAPLADVPFMGANPLSGDDTSTSLPDGSVNFSGYFGYVNSNPGNNNGEDPEVKTPSTSDYLTGKFTFNVPSTPDWTSGAVYGSDGNWVASSSSSTISGIYFNSSANKLWIVPSDTEQLEITTSDGGAIRAWMGGRIANNDLSGKIFGIYVDPEGNGGTFYSYLEGTACSYGGFVGSDDIEGTHFTLRNWADGEQAVSASELFDAAIESNDLLEGTTCSGNFVNGSGDVIGSITSDKVSGKTLGLCNQDWGIWRMQLMGNYTNLPGSDDLHGWNMMLGGTSPNISHPNDFSYWFGKAHSCDDCQKTAWSSGVLNSDFNGYYFSSNSEDEVAKIQVGIIEEGNFWGNYVETGSCTSSGTWEAIGGGEWFEVTDLLDSTALGFGSDLSTLQNFVSMPITEVHSNVMNNIICQSPGNSFTTAQMSPVFYTSATETAINIWVGQIIGTYSGNPGDSWALNLAGSPNVTDTVTLVGDRWSDGKWHANVVNGVSGTSTPGDVISYSGDAGGTYKDGKFFGVGAGTFTKNDNSVS